MKSPTEVKSLKVQVLQKQQIFNSQSLGGLSKNLGPVNKSQVQSKKSQNTSGGGLIPPDAHGKALSNLHSASFGLNVL